MPFSDEPGLIWKLASVVGFLCLVSAYLANQTGRCRSTGWRYLWANALGAGVLASYSARIDEPIFVGLEGFWCVASLWQWLRLRRRPDGASD